MATMRRSLEEYQKLIEENHKLIYFFLRKHNLDVDEFYGDAAIGLCKAAMEYDESLGYTFSSFAYKCIFNEVGYELRKRKKFKTNVFTVSYESLINGEDNIRLEDVLTDGYIAGDAAESSAFVMWFIGQLSERDLEVLYWRLQGATMREIAETIGFSRQTVVNSIKKMQTIITTNRRVHTLPRDHSKRSKFYRDRIIRTLSYI